MSDRWRRRTGFVVVAVVGLVGLVACGGGDSGTDPAPQTAEIEVAVQVDGAGLAGVSVGLFEASGASAASTRQTASNGAAVFTGLEPGAYEVEIEVPDEHELAEGQTARRSVTAPAGDRATVQFGLREVDTGIVEIRLTSGLRFEPSSVTISPGTTVRWVNEASMFHTVTPDGHSEWERQELSTSGQTFTHEFTDVGDFPYFCEPHESSGMTGSITVQ